MIEFHAFSFPELSKNKYKQNALQIYVSILDLIHIFSRESPKRIKQIIYGLIFLFSQCESKQNNQSLSKKK
eukprot:UN28756